MSTTKEERTKPPAAQPHDEGSTAWRMLCGAAVLYAALYIITLRAFAAVPVPLPSSAPPGAFAEGRAMAVTEQLASAIGHRQVSTLGEELAAQYLIDQGQQLVTLARETRPDDLEVLVVREQVSGSIGRQLAFNFELANAYNNLTNVIVRITPVSVVHNKTTVLPKAVLVNAHYDSALGSPGASDCVSCVGVALEIARTLVANSSLSLAGPVIFLFNGGEETLMQASHGFMASSAFSSEIGAFINLESTGPWGPDLVFQHTGDWTLRAYARAAPNPRGNTVAQDFFELGLVPADTDYRMLSYKHYGTIPGLDVAFIFDGTAYHTLCDTVDRIRPGTLQGMGNNVLATVLEMSRVLASSQGAQTFSEGATNATCGATHNSSKGEKGNVYFDVLTLFMAVYDHNTACVVHAIPLVVFVASWLVGWVWKRDTAFAIPSPLGVMRSASIAVIPIATGIALPAVLGGMRALISGHPLAWYGSELAAQSVYAPAALAGMLLPRVVLGAIKRKPTSLTSVPSSKSATKVAAQAVAAFCQLEASRQHAAGLAFLLSIVSAALTYVGVHSSYLLAAWSAGGLATVLALGMQLPPPSPSSTSSTALETPSREVLSLADGYVWRNVLTVLMCLSLPLLLALPTCMSMTSHLMEKAGFLGSSDQGGVASAVPDMAIGAVAGTSWALSIGTMGPYVAGALRHRPARLVFTGMLLASLLSAVWLSFVPGPAGPGLPYSVRHPKRMLVQHIHRHHPNGTVYDSIYSFATLDALPANDSLPEAVRSLPAVEFAAADWVSMYPVNYLVSGVATKAPGPPEDVLGTKVKTPTLVARKEGIPKALWRSMKASVGATGGDVAPGAGLTRWHLRLNTVRAAWAVLNITADVHAWSLGADVAKTPPMHAHKANASCSIIRYASSAATSLWSMWLDIPAEQSLRVDLYVKHLDVAPGTKAMVRQLPEWTSPAAVTTWQSSWQFG